MVFYRLVDMETIEEIDTTTYKTTSKDKIGLEK